MNILTEEELKEIETQFRTEFIFHPAFKVLDSHRALSERNHLLVLENDEQLAENMKLKDELKTAIHNRESSDMSREYAWMLNKQLNDINSEYFLKIKALEELK